MSVVLIKNDDDDEPHDDDDHNDDDDRLQSVHFLTRKKFRGQIGQTCE